MHRRTRSLRAIAVLLLAACGEGGGEAGGERAAEARERPGEWRMAPKDYANTRFSELDQVTAANVRDLAVAWTFSTGVDNGHEAAPLVVGSTMYIVTPWPNYLYALDLSRPGAPIRWRYDPEPARAAQGVACCDVVNRGAAYADGKIVYNTLDAHTVAVDAETGRQVWKTKLGDINQGETITMAPLVVKDKVLVGNSGGELGVRGWIAALELRTGALAWRAYNTGPDADVKIGEEYRAPYPQFAGKDLGVTSWPPGAWKVGGGNVWGWISYDPELDLIFHGTGNPGPWNPEQRPGDNLWTSGIFARDPDTGAARWFYQWTPHDEFDYDGTNENVLLELEIGGQRRKVIVRPERNGYVYVLDRATGKVLSAEPFAFVNTSRGVNLQTGRLIPNPAKKPRTGVMVEQICPAAPGAKDWSPSAYSPRTGLLYLPHNNLCMDMQAAEVNYISGTPFVGAQVRMYAGPGGHRGEFTAWDPMRQQVAWKLRERFPVWSGALATAGDVVFYGTMDGWFKALDARTGALLWRYKLGSGIIGQPITYLGPDGKQYVSVLSGVGGWAGAVVSAQLDTTVPWGALGFVGAMQDLPRHTTEGGTLYTFALP